MDLSRGPQRVKGKYSEEKRCEGVKRINNLAPWEKEWNCWYRKNNMSVTAIMSTKLPFIASDIAERANRIASIRTGAILKKGEALCGASPSSDCSSLVKVT